MSLVIRTRADSPDLKKAACSIEQAAWSDLGYLNYTRSGYELYTRLLEDFADYQLCLVDEARGYPVAVANCVPIKCSGLDELPAEGWDWLVENAAECQINGSANMLGALAVSVPSIYRSMGYARIMIRALLELSQRKGLNGLVVPVRPSSKAQHPTVSIDEYITWTDQEGRPYDPWLRSHIYSGGKIVRPCERSMVVHEHIGFWENWSKRKFDCSGRYEVRGALVPVEIDLARNVGSYEEPNVWVAYAGSA
ncbi:MAG: transferase [Hyphomicrobium sp.]